MTRPCDRPRPRTGIQTDSDESVFVLVTDGLRWISNSSCHRRTQMNKQFFLSHGTNSKHTWLDSDSSYKKVYLLPVFQQTTSFYHGRYFIPIVMVLFVHICYFNMISFLPWWLHACICFALFHLLLPCAKAEIIYIYIYIYICGASTPESTCRRRYMHTCMHKKNCMHAFR